MSGVETSTITTICNKLDVCHTVKQLDIHNKQYIIMNNANRLVFGLNIDAPSQIQDILVIKCRQRGVTKYLDHNV